MTAVQRSLDRPSPSTAPTWPRERARGTLAQVVLVAVVTPILIWVGIWLGIWLVDGATWLAAGFLDVTEQLLAGVRLPVLR